MDALTGATVMTAGGGKGLAGAGLIKNDRPVYIELRNIIVASILDGKVAEGQALPSVRALAMEYGVNPLTVAKAFQALQDQGLIVARRGVGRFVSEGAADRLRALRRKEFLETRWPGIAAEMRRLGIDASTLIEPTPIPG